MLHATALVAYAGSRHKVSGALAKLAQLIQIVGAASILLSSLGFVSPASAAPFLDDFEGDRESSRYPVKNLQHWTIIQSVDLKTERILPPICRDTGTCVDLVGTAGLTTGGIMSKASYPQGTYLIGFMLYGSGRDQAGNGIETGGTVSRIQVSFGSRSIYANNNIASDFAEFVLLRVSGAGKLRFLAGGEVEDIGPLVDNALIIQLHAPASP